MKIIHICSYFNTSKLYKNLFESLANINVKQEVFIPLYKNEPLVPENYGTVREKEKSRKNISYTYINCLYKPERYFLKHRIRKLYRILNKNISISDYDLLHGHSLFANGGICYLVKKRYNIDYLVAFRNTDLSVYKKFFYYRNLAKKIISHSSKLIFVSYALKYKFLDLVKDQQFKEIIKKKSVVVPNGLTEKWYNPNIKKDIKNIDKESKVNFIYQGTFHKRKNIEYIIKIIEELNDQNINANFKLVGGGPQKDSLLKLINNSRYKSKFNIENWTNNLEELINNYKDNDIFIMPSSNETFGISYIEALSIGLPIVYKNRDGIDGFFSKYRVGKKISTKNLYYDVKRIIDLIDNYQYFRNNTQKVINDFRWSNISEKYLNYYKNILLAGDNNETL